MAGGKIRFRFCLLRHWRSRKNLMNAAGISRVALLHRHGYHVETLRLNSGEVTFEQNGQSAHTAAAHGVTAAALLPNASWFAGPEHEDFRADWRAVV